MKGVFKAEKMSAFILAGFVLLASPWSVQAMNATGGSDVHKDKATYAVKNNADLKSRVEAALHNYKEVTVKIHDDNQIVLAGFVKDEAERKAAFEHASHVAGVLSVTNDIKISHNKNVPAGEHHSDTAITAKVKGKFLVQKGLDSLDIHVKTENGVVSLAGEVDEHSQIALAEKVTREVTGVKGVINHLKAKK